MARYLVAASLMISAVACDHSEPFSPVAGESGPFAPLPERLTFNSRHDSLNGYTSDGSELFYTYCEDIKTDATPPCGEFNQPDALTVPADRCLGALPVAGGSRVVERCGNSAADRDSLKIYRSGTRLADGSLVFAYDSRRTSASFSIDPALYVLRPGALSPVRLLSYTPNVYDLLIPSRILAAGGQQVVTLGGAGPELITVHDDNTVTRVAIPPLVALDPAAGIGLTRSDDNLFRVSLPNGAAQLFASIPQEGDWAGATTSGIGYAAGRALVAQSRTYLVGTTTFQEGRLVMLEGDAGLTEVVRAANLTIGQVVVSPDGKFVAVERGGDLYRYALP